MAKQDEPNKVIYSMVGVGKVHGTKQVLRDIYLGYFYGAKIGVIGLNRSGKSTLLRIMAGVEKEFIGEVAIAPGYSVGFLEQEPGRRPRPPCCSLPGTTRRRFRTAGCRWRLWPTRPAPTPSHCLRSATPRRGGASGRVAPPSMNGRGSGAPGCQSAPNRQP